jgi:DNA-binding protein WhiA
VEDVLAIGGASVSAMASMQQKLVRELRGEVNRKSNCEVKNIRRATSAATLQLEAIKKLRASGKFDLLPDELKETAILREEEPEMPLSELAQRHVPPISKSGLNHRMEKLLSAAEKI